MEITAKKTYGDRVVLDVENLRFETGTRYALIGANGSGKSTLLQAIAGTIRFEGSKTGFQNLDIGYMPQQSYAFSMSVLNNLLVPCKAAGIPLKRAMAKEMLKRVELDKLSRKNASRLSGGETQRVALCRVIMFPHDILLLDEPSASMDVRSSLIVENALEEYLDDSDCTLIFATHSLKQAERLADEVIFLDNGKIAERGRPRDVLQCPKQPETRKFLEFFAN